MSTFLYGKHGGCLSCAFVMGAGEGRLVSMMITDLEILGADGMVIALLM